MRDVEAVWRAVAGPHPVPAPLLALLTDTTDAYAVLSGNRVSFGLTGLGRSGLDAALRALPQTYNVDLIDRIFTQLIEGRMAIDWGLEVEVGGEQLLLRLRGDSPHIAADISELKATLEPELSWPDDLPQTGSVQGWSVALQADGQIELELEAPARAAWLPADAHDALRDLPELGMVRVSATPGEPLRYASRTLIGESDPSASWEAARVPLAAYGRVGWADLGQSTSARPYAVRLDGEDVSLEIYAS